MPGRKQSDQLPLASLPQPAMENLTKWLDGRSLIRLRMTNRFFNTPSAKNHLTPALKKLLQRCSAEFCAGYALLLLDGRLYAWGENTAGILGIGLKGFSQPHLSKPTLVDLPRGQRIIQTVLADDYWLALSKTGRVFVSGKQADGTYIPGGSPVNVVFPKGINIVRLYSSHGAHYALTDEGLVYAWGENARGQLGLGEESFDIIREPQLLKSIQHRHITHIELTPGSVYFLTRSGTVYSCGQQHQGPQVTQKSPTKLTALKPHKIKEIIISKDNSSVFALTQEGKVFAWGANHYGLLGINTQDHTSTPTLIAIDDGVAIAKLYDIASMTQGGNLQSQTIMALTTNGELYTWGANVTIFNPEAEHFSVSPVKIPLPFAVKSIFIKQIYCVINTTAGETYAMSIDRWVKEGSTERAQLQQLALPANSHVVSVHSVVNAEHLALTNTGVLYVWYTGHFSNARPVQDIDTVAHLLTGSHQYVVIDTQGYIHNPDSPMPIANAFALINAPEPVETEPMIHFNRT